MCSAHTNNLHSLAFSSNVFSGPLPEVQDDVRARPSDESRGQLVLAIAAAQSSQRRGGRVEEANTTWKSKHSQSTAFSIRGTGDIGIAGRSLAESSISTGTSRTNVSYCLRIAALLPRDEPCMTRPLMLSDKLLGGLIGTQHDYECQRCTPPLTHVLVGPWHQSLPLRSCQRPMQTP
jgi:hypothetical protein